MVPFASVSLESFSSVSHFASLPAIPSKAQSKVVPSLGGGSFSVVGTVTAESCLFVTQKWELLCFTGSFATEALTPKRQVPPWPHEK